MRPGTSTVNVTDYWQTRANTALTPLTERGLAVAASAGGHVVYDEVGWFTGDAPPSAGPVEFNDPTGTLPHPATPCDSVAPGMDGLAAGSSHMPEQFVRFGSSVEGRALYAEYWGPPNPEHVVLVVGTVHGNECAPQRLIRAFRSAPPSGSYGAWVVPTLNPDGAVAMTRVNANGHDLNKDGARASQPETVALLELTRRLRPDLTVHVHSPNGMVGWYGSSTPPDGAPTSAGPRRAASIAQRISAASARADWPGLRFTTAGHRADPGIWFLWQGQGSIAASHEAVLVELYAVADDEVPVASPRPPTRDVATADAHAAAVLDALEQFL